MISLDWPVRRVLEIWRLKLEPWQPGINLIALNPHNNKICDKGEKRTIAGVPGEKP